MCGCHRADRSIWALSTVLALPISPHRRLYSCCVSDRDTHTHTHARTHKYQFTEGGSCGLRTGSSPHRAACMVYVLKQQFEMRTLSHYFFDEKTGREAAWQKEVHVYLCGKRAVLFPVSSRKACQSYGLNATVLRRIHTHTARELNGVYMWLCVHMCAFMLRRSTLGCGSKRPN